MYFIYLSFAGLLPRENYSSPRGSGRARASNAPIRAPTASRCGSRSVAGRTSSSPMTSSRTGAIYGRSRSVLGLFGTCEPYVSFIFIEFHHDDYFNH